ncbi:MAG: OmpA family protein [Nannocystaceae bacterium]
MRRALLATLMVAFLLPGCKKDELEKALKEANDKLSATQRDLDSEREKNKQLEADKAKLAQKIAELEEEIKQLTAQIDDYARKAGVSAEELKKLREEKAKQLAELKVYQDLINQLKKLVDAGTIQLEFRKGMLVVKLSNAILFDSGKTELKPEGQAAIGELAQALQTVGDRDFLVSGHTDNVPIKTARFKSNWELSTARAVEVVKHMIDSGMNPLHVGAAGFGENDPVADNSTEDGRAQNRRIEVVLLPKLGDIPGMKEMIMGTKKKS